MGEVYRADDLKLGQTVALKFLPTDVVNDPKRMEYFYNEVRLSRQVSHPNVCRVYDISEVDGDRFLAMEYIDGEDLKSLLKRIGRLPNDKGIELARQLCAGLDAAHQKGSSSSRPETREYYDRRARTCANHRLWLGHRSRR